MARSRDLLWDGCRNIRDLGGLPTDDGRETRFGVVVRADNVTLLSDEGWQALADYGVRRIVDLRHAEELDEDRPHKAGIDVVHTPTVADSSVFAEVDQLLAGITEPLAWRRANYLEILRRAAPNFGRAVSAVANSSNGAVLIHCAGGVDRTGLVSALLLRVAGVSIDTVAADWAESEQNWAPAIQPWLDAAPTEEERAKRQFLSVMPAGAMRDVLVELEDRHGSAREYLADAGVADPELDAIRDRLRA